MLSTISRLFAVSVLALLSGCFDLAQTFTVSDNQSATMNFTFTLDSELVGMGEDMELDPESSCESRDFLAGELPEGLTRVSDIRVEGTTLICEYAVTGPLTAFEELSADVQEANGGFDLITLEILDDHRARIVSIYDFSDDEVDQDEGAMERSLRRMIASNFEGHNIQWRIDAPTVLESNGDIAADGRSVTWTLPIEDALMARKQYRFEAVIDYVSHQSRFF